MDKNVKSITGVVIFFKYIFDLIHHFSTTTLNKALMKISGELMDKCWLLTLLEDCRLQKVVGRTEYFKVCLNGHFKDEITELKKWMMQ